MITFDFQLKGGRPNKIEDLAQGNRFFHVYGKRAAQKLHHMKVTLEDDITTLGDQLGDQIWPQETGKGWTGNNWQGWGGVGYRRFQY